MTSRHPRSPSQKALVQAVLKGSAGLLDPEDVRSLLANAFAAAAEFLPVDLCEIAVTRAQLNACDLYSVAAGRAIEHRSAAADRGLIGRALRLAEGEYLSQAELAQEADPEADARFLARSPRGAVLCPLRDFRGELRGALLCAATTQNANPADDIGAILVFALHLGAALQHLQARHDLRHWDAIARSSYLPIIGLDARGAITHWNPAAERMFGWRAPEVIGESIGRILAPDVVGDLPAILERVRRSEAVEELEVACVNRHARHIVAAVAASPVRASSGEVVGGSWIFRDVTAARRENERFRLAVESAPNAMLLTDESGRILLANVEAEHLFGYAREELTGSPIDMLVPSDVRAMHGQHRRSFLAEPQKRAMGGGRDLWAVRKDGTRVPVEVGLNPIHGESERTVLASIVDISERRRIERERARLLAETQQAVEARDTFLSVASHELKTPLAALQLTTQALVRRALRRPESFAGPELTEKLGATTRQVARLTTLVDQLLDVSRLTAGRLQLECSPTDLASLARDVVDRFAQGAERCDIRIGECDTVSGQWDAGRIDQVLTNLIANAVKYGEGSPIEVEVIERSGQALVSVRDHGPGIAAEDQARIFERFERLVSHRHFGGFGLGLWIARQLVEAHGGRIEVISQPRRGAQFIVSLPKSTDARANFGC